MNEKKVMLVTLAIAVALESLSEDKNASPHPEVEMVSAVYNPTGVNTYGIAAFYPSSGTTFTGFATLVTS